MRKRRRLISQLIPSYILIVFLSLAAVSWLAFHSLRDLFVDRTSAALETQANLALKQIAQDLKQPDGADIDAITKFLGRGISTRITVILSDGSVAGDSQANPTVMDNHGDRPEIKIALGGQIGKSVRHSTTLDHKMVYVAVPLSGSSGVDAVVRTALPMTAIEREIQSIQVKIAVGGLVIAILASAICFLVAKRISRPLDAMIEGAEKFAAGDLTHRLSQPDTVEMVSLADALNVMAAQLQERLNDIISQRNEFEAVLASMNEGVIAIDLSERILNMNQTAEIMLEIARDEAKGRRLYEMLRYREVQKFTAEASAKDESMAGDVVLYDKGERVWYLQASPLKDSSDHRFGTLIMINDVTKMRRLENVRRDFVANVSHEIKTPLTAIKGFVETLQSCALDDPEGTNRFLGIIDKHVDRLAAIVEDLMQLSRIEGEHEWQKVQLANTDVIDPIRTAIFLCQDRADQKGIKLKLVGDKSLQANIDVHLMEQALVNLIDNSIKYSHEGSEVRIGARRNGNLVDIFVADEGIGIPQKHHPRLFERFYRVDQARSRKLGGTGLGLAIVKHIVIAHNGTVEVESALGKGSTFTIHLPV